VWHKEERMAERDQAKEPKVASKSRGCGNEWGSCGGNHHKPFQASTTCGKCGRKVSATCNTVPNCPGKSFTC